MLGCVFLSYYRSSCYGEVHSIFVYFLRFDYLSTTYPLNFFSCRKINFLCTRFCTMFDGEFGYETD